MASSRPTWSTSDGKVALYRGDCRDVLSRRKVRPGECCITDPPFNIGYHYENGDDSLTPKEYSKLLSVCFRWPVVLVHYPEDTFAIAAALSVSPTKCVAWVYNANTARQWRLLSWFGIEPDFAGMPQPYKNPTDKRVRKRIEEGSQGAALYDWWNVEQVKNVSPDKTEHPCQMPYQVMRRCVGITPCTTVIDPFMGSGTTLLAAMRLGRPILGVERHGPYFDIAVDRIKEELTRHPLLEAAPNIVQRELIA